MPADLQFFVDLDPDTMRRIDVSYTPDGHYSVTSTLQFDAGWEAPEKTLEILDRKRLAKHLIRQGVPSEQVHEKLGTPRPQSPSWLVAALAVVFR